MFDSREREPLARVKRRLTREQMILSVFLRRVVIYDILRAHMRQSSGVRKPTNAKQALLFRHIGYPCLRGCLQETPDMQSDPQDMSDFAVPYQSRKQRKCRGNGRRV